MDEDTLTSSFDNDNIPQEFTNFCRIVHESSGYSPYPWQIRLAQRVIRSGRWPSVIAAPTGAGKTSVVDVHVFAQIRAGLHQGANVPRRLALIVNRRALVDDQFDYAQSLTNRLFSSAEGGNPTAMRYVRALEKRSPQTAHYLVEHADVGEDIVQVVNLRGGQALRDPAMSSWRQWPDRVSILCFTPEMFGSRLLFRGYGVGRGSREIEAGLLSYDTVAIVDEAHLSQQLVITAQQVPRIETHAEHPLSLPPLQTVVCTATPQKDSLMAGQALPQSHNDRYEEYAGDVNAIEVTEDDLDSNEQLRQRLHACKPVSIVNLDCAINDPSRKEGLNSLIEEAIAIRDGVGGTVGVVVNTVASAVAVTRELRSREHDGDVVMIVGRMRPFDRESIGQRYPGLLSSQGNPDVSFVVGTQTLEVGLDVGFSGMVTELSSGDALAQRVGRVNRFADHSSSPIVVAVPPMEAETANGHQGRGRSGSGIYSADELDAAREWLEKIRSIAPAEGMSPWITSRCSPPRTHLRRPVLQRLEWWDADNLSACSEDTCADSRILDVGPTDVNLWLQDDLDDRGTIGLAVRGNLPQGDALALRLLDEVPVLEEEIARVPMAQMRVFARRMAAVADGLADESAMTRPRAFIVRAEGGAERMRADSVFTPGDVVVLSAETRAFDQDVFSPDGGDRLSSGDVLDAVVDIRSLREWKCGRSDRHHDDVDNVFIPSTWMVRLVVPRNDSSSSVIAGASGLTRDDLWELANSLRLSTLPTYAQETLPTEDGPGDETEVDPRRVLLKWVFRHPFATPHKGFRCSGASFDDLRSLAAGGQKDRERLSRLLLKDRTVVDYLGTDDGDDEFAVIIASRMVMDDELRQVSTSSTKRRVLLDSHEKDVGDRAYEICEAVELDGFASCMKTAGLLHDEGKRDSRFQRLLGYGRPLAKVYAKSGFASRGFERRFRSQMHLIGWRHEQRSAAEAWIRLSGESVSNRELITRMVGATHGHGLNTFDHGSDTLLPENEEVSDELRNAASDLFDGGYWEYLVERTKYRFGIWGVAYLDAILRSADVQVSAEGR